MPLVKLRIGPADQGRKMTLQEFWDAEEETGYLYELARGVLEVSEIPGDLHWQVIHNLHELFSLHGRQYPGLIHRIGHGSEVRYIIPEFETDRHPDLAILFRGETRHDVKGRVVSVLGVEVVSPGKRSRDRDYLDKRTDYLAFGLLEYWIVDPDLRQATVLARREVDGVPAWEERIFSGDDVILSDLLPGFAGIVSELWTDLDSEG
jgi:Uma2 family endonuclease